MQRFLIVVAGFTLFLVLVSGKDLHSQFKSSRYSLVSAKRSTKVPQEHALTSKTAELTKGLLFSLSSIRGGQTEQDRDGKNSLRRKNKKGNTQRKSANLSAGSKRNTALSQADADNNEAETESKSDISNEEMTAEDGESSFSINKLPFTERAIGIWNKTPPITQAYLGSSMAITLLSFLLNGNRWPDFLHFDWTAVLTGQVWRFVTSFMYFGQLDMFFPLTMQFIWQHMSQLEKLNHSAPEDFLVMILFGAASLLSLYTVLGISTRFLGHNFGTFLVYIWSRVFEGTDVNFMDLVTLKSEMLPWFFCAQTFLLEREVPIADLIGIAVGHVYYYLKQKDIIKVPDSLRKWFASDAVKRRYAKFTGDFE
jgi:Derlin-2/3